MLMGVIVLIGTAGVMTTDLPRDMMDILKETLAATQQQ